MSAIHAVLLVPHEGDPYKLLGDPDSAAWRLGSRPPVAMECPWCERWVPLADNCECGCDACNIPHRRALGLAWEGEETWQGYEYASQALPPTCNVGFEVSWALELGTSGAIGGLRDVLETLGTIVPLDADGRELDGGAA